jgi:hypothetical protein
MSWNDTSVRSGTLKRMTGRSAPRLLRRYRPTRAAIPRRLPRREIRLAVRVELLRRTEAEIRMAAVQQFIRVGRVEVKPFGLAIRPVQAADVGPLVPVEAEPPQILENAGFRLARRALGVGVLDAENERAVLAVRKQPVEQRRARVAHMEVAGGAGGETNSHH